MNIDPILLEKLATAIDILEGATLTLSTPDLVGLASELGDVRDLLVQISNEEVIE